MRIWERFPEVFAAVRKSHEEANLVGHHDFVHAARVGEIAYRAALEEWEDARTADHAGLAGLCHNADRILQKMFDIGRKDVPVSDVTAMVHDWLGRDGALKPPAIELITNAVLRHSGKNSKQDSRALIALMDADRVVNLDVDLFVRSGQFYHDLPVMDYKLWLSDSSANYQSPNSVLRDISFSLEWADPDPKNPFGLRTRLGNEMGQRRAKLFSTFFDTLREQLAEEGVYPLPPQLS